MNKELIVIDTLETPEIETQPTLIKLDDLSLALVGGGQATVDI